MLSFGFPRGPWVHLDPKVRRGIQDSMVPPDSLGCQDYQESEGDRYNLNTDTDSVRPNVPSPNVLLTFKWHTVCHRIRKLDLCQVETSFEASNLCGRHAV